MTSGRHGDLVHSLDDGVNSNRCLRPLNGAPATILRKKLWAGIFELLVIDQLCTYKVVTSKPLHRLGLGWSMFPEHPSPSCALNALYVSRMEDVVQQCLARESESVDLLGHALGEIVPLDFAACTFLFFLHHDSVKMYQEPESLVRQDLSRNVDSTACVHAALPLLESWESLS